ncbi:hypothetical protein Bbelb_200190 [Branchiostoma belcheri]|nr:hypothetical protein Bbelb_200190 [Branchiostoma belcheri]
MLAWLVFCPGIGNDLGEAAFVEATTDQTSSSDVLLFDVSVRETKLVKFKTGDQQMSMLHLGEVTGSQQETDSLPNCVMTNGEESHQDVVAVRSSTTTIIDDEPEKEISLQVFKLRGKVRQRKVAGLLDCCVCSDNHTYSVLVPFESGKHAQEQQPAADGREERATYDVPDKMNTISRRPKPRIPRNYDKKGVKSDSNLVETGLPDGGKRIGIYY